MTANSARASSPSGTVSTLVPAGSSDWYIEAISRKGKPLWSVFVPGFQAAWTFYNALQRQLAETGGCVRVRAAETRSPREVSLFDKAGALSRNILSGCENSTQKRVN